MGLNVSCTGYQAPGNTISGLEDRLRSAPSYNSAKMHRFSGALEDQLGEEAGSSPGRTVAAWLCGRSRQACCLPRPVCPGWAACAPGAPRARMGSGFQCWMRPSRVDRWLPSEEGLESAELTHPLPEAPGAGWDPLLPCRAGGSSAACR